MKYLGVDWGLKKVGIALSEGALASPLDILSIRGLDDGVEKIVEIVKREEINVIVIGKPEGESGQRVEGAINKLKKVGLEVIEVDETLSTREAKKALLQMGASRKSRRADDAMAAAIILQNYLDEQL